MDNSDAYGHIHVLHADTKGQGMYHIGIGVGRVLWGRVKIWIIEGTLGRKGVYRNIHGIIAFRGMIKGIS